MINFERLDDWGGVYLVSFTGCRVFCGPELVEPVSGSTYRLQHPDRPGQAEEYSFEELWAAAYGVIIPGFSQYTLTARGVVFDNEGNRCQVETLPVIGTGNHMGNEPAARLIADDGSEHTRRISDLLKMINVHVPFTARTPSHVIDDSDDSEPPSWYRRIMPQSQEPAPISSPPPAPSMRGRMGRTNERGRMGR